MCQYEKCTDEELLTRLRSGEEEISDYLMEKYKGFVRQKARAMFLIGGETDDLIQEGMIGLLRGCALTDSFTVLSRIQTGRSICL